MRLLRLFWLGMMISFVGTLPLGTLNISAMQISVSDGTRPALLFALGALLVEVIYVRLSLVAMNWISGKKKLFRIFEWATVLLIFALAVSSFFAAAHPGVEKNVILSNSVHRFWLGVMLSAINPLQIPFWFGWSTALYSRNILQRKASQFNVYILGIGLGTLLGNLVFIIGGRFIVDRLNASQAAIHYIIGIVFALTAIALLLKMVRKKDAIAQMNN